MLVYKVAMGRALVDFTIRYLVCSPLPWRHPSPFTLAHQMATQIWESLRPESRVRWLRGWQHTFQRTHSQPGLSSRAVGFCYLVRNSIKPSSALFPPITDPKFLVLSLSPPNREGLRTASVSGFVYLLKWKARRRRKIICHQRNLSISASGAPTTSK
jgi:hypothetical protein